MKLVAPAVVALLLAPQTAFAVMTFTQIDDDVFLVSHRVKIIGSRGKATKMVYTKAASLCQAAGFSHYAVLSQESQASQSNDAANASLRVKFFLGAADDRQGCRASADPTYVKEATTKLRKMGYRPPSPESTAAASQAAPASGTAPGGCSIEQIAGMARSGLSDQQIKSACS